jgi:hypothetical protein
LSCLLDGGAYVWITNIAHTVVIEILLPRITVVQAVVIAVDRGSTGARSISDYSAQVPIVENAIPI